MVGLVVVSAILGSSCGGSGNSASAELDFPLSADAKLGRSVAKDAGCNSCHGANGEGGVGPVWTGLAGSEVTLDDGSVVTADRDYLIRAIIDPSAEKVEGYPVAMPLANLTDAQVSLIVTYIEELS